VAVTAAAAAAAEGGGGSVVAAAAAAAAAWAAPGARASGGASLRTFKKKEEQKKTEQCHKDKSFTFKGGWGELWQSRLVGERGWQIKNSKSKSIVDQMEGCYSLLSQARRHH
jgi:hypothetical protein